MDIASSGCGALGGFGHNELLLETLDWEVIFVLKDANEKILMKAAGKQRGLEPLVLECSGEAAGAAYPSYEIVTVKGMAEVIEHRRQEPAFYVTDDPSVLAKLGVKDTAGRK